MKKKIGILGSGVVGKTLASAFQKEGYEVMIGSRDPEKLSEFIEDQNTEILSGSFDQTAEFGDTILLAVKGKAAKEVLKNIGDERLEDKVIIDATNPIEDREIIDGVLHFFTDQNYSLMEELQDSFPRNKFVKAFNSIGSAHMYKPSFSSKPSMFICGNDEEAKKEVEAILSLFGWEVEDMGKAKAAGSIESLCKLWCIRGFKDNQWDHAFHLLKK